MILIIPLLLSLLAGLLLQYYRCKTKKNIMSLIIIIGVLILLWSILRGTGIITFKYDESDSALGNMSWIIGIYIFVNDIVYVLGNIIGYEIYLRNI